MAIPAGRMGINYDDEGWTTSAGWFRDRFNFAAGAGNFHPGTSPVRSRLSANLRNSRATGLGPYSVTASFTVTATPSSESLAFSCRSNQCLIDNATCATSCLSERLHRWPAPRPERRSKLMQARAYAQAKRQADEGRFRPLCWVRHKPPILRTWVLTFGIAHLALLKAGIECRESCGRSLMSSVAFCLQQHVSLGQ